MKRTGSVIWGIFLIVIGILFIVGRIYYPGFLNISDLWPLFILVPGLIFELTYFTSKQNPGLLVPGGILTCVGIIFLVFTMVDSSTIEYTWTLFPMAVAIGLFQLYLTDRTQWGILIPVGILGGVSVILFASFVDDTSLGMLIIAAAFITGGLAVILGGLRKK